MGVVPLGSHRSCEVAKRDGELAYIQLKRWKESGCPFTDIKKLADFTKVEAYYEAYYAAKADSMSGTKSTNFEKFFSELSSQEREAHISSMRVHVGTSKRISYDFVDVPQ